MLDIQSSNPALVLLHTHLERLYAVGGRTLPLPRRKRLFRLKFPDPRLHLGLHQQLMDSFLAHSPSSLQTSLKSVPQFL